MSPYHGHAGGVARVRTVDCGGVGVGDVVVVVRVAFVVQKLFGIRGEDARELVFEVVLAGGSLRKTLEPDRSMTHRQGE